MKSFFSFLLFFCTLVTVILFTTPFCHAAEQQSLNYAQFNYIEKDPDTLNIDPKGLGFRGRWSVNGSFFVGGEMSFTTDDNVDLEEQEFIFAYVFNPEADLKLHLGFLFEHQDIESVNIKSHQFGKGLQAGWVWDISRYVDFHGAVDAIYADDDVTATGRVGFFYNFYSSMGVDVSYELDDDDNTKLTVGYRFIF